MTQAITKPEEVMPPAKPIDPAILHQVIIGGDLSKLTEVQQLEYYNAVCAAAGVNPATRPFAFIRLNNRLVLYALKDCTEQLRVLHGVSVTEMQGKMHGGVYVVTAKGQNGQGRIDMATGAVPAKGLSGDRLANALMKAETKAKRRLTLSICGLGVLDETELETIPDVQPPSAEPEDAEPQAPAQVASDSPQDDSQQKPEDEPRQPTNYAATDTPEQAAMRKDIFDAIVVASQGESAETREAWTEELTSFTPKGKARVAGVRRLQYLSPAKTGKKTGRLEIVHAGIKKGKIDKATFAEWKANRAAEAELAAQDAAADAPQDAPADLLTPPKGEEFEKFEKEVDETIPF